MWAHLGALLLALVGWALTLGVLAFAAWAVPLIIMNLYGDRSAYVRESARESLNFQLSWLLYAVVVMLWTFLLGIVTFGFALFVFIPLAILGAVVELVFNIIGAVKASRGELWRYPLIIRFVR